jgi:uncharacterized membrane protein
MFQKQRTTWYNDHHGLILADPSSKWIPLMKIHKKNRHYQIAFGLVLLLGMILRLYQSTTPLWLDELYSYLMTQQNLTTIIQNSWTDPHPPLFYILQWLLSGFGAVRSEFGWRWFSILCGTLTIGMIGLTVRKISHPFVSIVTMLMAATSPTLIYFSQEARSYAFLILLASISFWFVLTILENPENKSGWIGWLVTCLLGLFSGYSYTMIFGFQVLFLGIYHFRRWIWWLSSGLLMMGTLILVPFMRSSLLRKAAAHQTSKALSTWRILQTIFSGEALRYGTSAAHQILPILVIILCTSGLLIFFKQWQKSLLFISLQVIFPFFGFLLISQVTDIRIPQQDAKQFLVLLPFLYALIGKGFENLKTLMPKRLFNIIAGVVCLCFIVLNGLNLRTYWKTPKSPEALIVFALKEEMRPDDTVVSLQYPIDYALGFYTEGLRTYLNPQEKDGQYVYQLMESDQIFNIDAWSAHTPNTTADIRAWHDFWVIARSGVNNSALEKLTQNCDISSRTSTSIPSGTFELFEVNCPIPEG